MDKKSPLFGKITSMSMDFVPEMIVPLTGMSVDFVPEMIVSLTGMSMDFVPEMIVPLTGMSVDFMRMLRSIDVVIIYNLKENIHYS